MKKDRIIYKTVNKINGKFYIGQDSFNNPNYLGSGKIFLKALKKYGKESFEKEIIDTAETDLELDEKERWWIDKLNAIEEGYNIAVGGQGGKVFDKGSGFSGKVHSNQTKKKISSSMIRNSPFNKGKIIVNNGIIQKYILPDEIESGWTKGSLYKPSENSRKKMSESARKRTDRKKVSESLKNYYSNHQFSKDQKRKISEANKKENKGKRVWISKNKVTKMVKEKELQIFLSDGWQKGRN